MMKISAKIRRNRALRYYRAFAEYRLIFLVPVALGVCQVLAGIRVASETLPPRRTGTFYMGLCWVILGVYWRHVGSVVLFLKEFIQTEFGVDISEEHTG